MGPLVHIGKQNSLNNRISIILRLLFLSPAQHVLICCQFYSSENSQIIKKFSGVAVDSCGQF